jgi:hypothetical protein
MTVAVPRRHSTTYYGEYFFERVKEHTDQQLAPWLLGKVAKQTGSRIKSVDQDTLA